MAAVIVDAGPLIAAFDRREHHHKWVLEQLSGIRPPLLTCEPAFAEAMFGLQRLPGTQDGLMGLLDKGVLSIAFHIEDHAPVLRRLLAKYRDRPMSLADACLVRMAEVHERHALLTLDSDFTFYRKHGRLPLDLLMPAVN